MKNRYKAGRYCLPFKYDRSSSWYFKASMLQYLNYSFKYWVIIIRVRVMIWFIGLFTCNYA